ncbi:hypothetical protein Purlil1_8457 [Purpureocillium lilacinum]|uniref:Uncharacterized protein n=1 Tax=Purpureocillium lilacinum TaxID=33203 RepID=A0ABR0BSX5_PURLI|nr:hypothetical protein Purlil1_8457 [Purpureocillium lilacinum]
MRGRQGADWSQKGIGGAGARRARRLAYAGQGCGGRGRGGVGGDEEEEQQEQQEEEEGGGGRFLERMHASRHAFANASRRYGQRGDGPSQVGGERGKGRRASPPSLRELSLRAYHEHVQGRGPMQCAPRLDSRHRAGKKHVRRDLTARLSKFKGHGLHAEEGAGPKGVCGHQATHHHHYRNHHGGFSFPRIAADANLTGRHVWG